MKTKFKKPGKKAVIITSVIVLLAAVGCGVWYYLGHSSSDPVYVYPFQYIGMTEFWGDSKESYGPVSTDKIQTIFLSDTQTVTEVCVKEGDKVKKGDLLMTFDTTLSDLALERERLKVEKLKLDLEDAKRELRKIRGMKPMKLPTFDPSDDFEEADMGYALTEPFKLSEQKGYDGSTPEKSLICWLNSETTVDNDLLEKLRQTAEYYQNFNAESGGSSSASEAETEEIAETDPTETEPTETEPAETEPAETEPAETEPTETDPIETDPIETDPIETDPIETEPDETEAPTEKPYEPFPVNDFYVVFKVTRENMSLAQRTSWQGLHVYSQSGGFFFKLFDATTVPDHMMIGSGEEGGSLPGMPDIDYGSGFTAAQIAQMRSDQEKKIKDLEFSIKMADADYKIMQTEVSDGSIHAEFDGTVIGLLDEQTAKDTMQPVLKVSGGGGFYVEGSVSELDKDRLIIGQEVTVNDWRSGMTYTGTVKSIGDFPSMNESWGMGNPNASFYPFQVFIDESADLQSGSYVNVTYSAGESQNGIYLENPFIRTENGKSYVLVLGKDGRLEQKFVTTGKALWGSYTEVLGGITAEDKIAFPYGKNVRPGVAAVEGDLSNLYG